MNEPVVEMTNVTKKYGDVVAVQSISLRVERGEVLGVLGPNGAGKTTTVECAIGLRSPDAGTIRVLGLDPSTAPDAVRQRVVVQLQQATKPTTSASVTPSPWWCLARAPTPPPALDRGLIRPPRP
jgi:ABC-2 type transport system ATP-binding protein